MEKEIETKINQIVELYNESSKHSNYQVLPSCIKELLPDSIELETQSRYEWERLEYIKSHLELVEKNVLDIGGNTGFFSFELTEQGVSEALVVEGNSEHAEFINEVSKLLNREEQVRAVNRYFDFYTPEQFGKFDIVLLLNVLHHTGDDFGDRNLEISEVQDKIARQLNSMAGVAEHIVFQLGFNWKGDVTLPIFRNGTKREMIEFVTRETKEHWDLRHVGIPEQADTDRVVYREMNDENIVRRDELGEFLNRPLFIMKSMRYL